MNAMAAFLVVVLTAHTAQAAGMTDLAVDTSLRRQLLSLQRRAEDRPDRDPSPSRPLSPRSPSKSVADCQAHVPEAAAKYDVSPALLSAIIHVESAGNSRARSHAGAVGCMQLMPATARHMGVEDPGNARENVMGGARYLRHLETHLGKTYDRKLGFGPLLAAYNAGPGNVPRGRSRYRGAVSYVRSVLRWLPHFERYWHRGV